MNSKSVEYFQQEQKSDIPPIPSIDANYILLNRGIKYLLNFLLIYLFVTVIVYNYSDLQVHVFIILVCAVSSIVFYILDLNFPSCYI
jgi:hypothetical protein